MGDIIRLKDREDILEQILFEFIVMATDVPDEDKKISASTICTLSQLPTEINNYLTLCSTMPFEVWKEMYSVALYENGKDKLADEINDTANKILGR